MQVSKNSLFFYVTTFKEEDLLSPFPLSPRGTSTEGEGEERGPEEVIDNIFTPEGTPHLVIPEDADRYGL